MHDITISALGNTVDSDTCRKRLIECRDWIDKTMQQVLNDSNANYETKKFVADVAKYLILYIQECSSAVFNYSYTSNKD